MGRHIGDEQEPEIEVGRSGVGLPGRLALAAAAVVVIVGAAVLLAPRDVLAQIPWASAPPCPTDTVRMTVEPELHDPVVRIVKPLVGRSLPGDRCLAIEVDSQEGPETAAGSNVLPADRAPQLWIPDSPVWVEKATAWRTQEVTNFASSPVVVTTSRNAAVALGWTKKRPTWNEALRGKRPAAVPDIQSEADSLSALIALWQTLGKGAAADTAVVNLVLAADRGEVPTAEQALAIARSGSVNSPVVPATEQAVAAANKTALKPAMAAVYPLEGSPVLSYPVTRVTTPGESASLAAGVALIVDRLRNPVARNVAHTYGFRGPDGSPGIGDGISGGPVKAYTPPDKAEVDGMLSRIDKLSRPSRLLAVLDVSLSMKERLGDGLRRLDLAAGAARLGANVLPNRSSVGLWVFASDFGGGKDYREIGPIRPLGSRTERGELWRDHLQSLIANPDRYLKDGGTSLYDTVLAASRKMHAEYDPKAISAIIVISDGTNDDAEGVQLPQLLAELKRVNAGRQKVAIYTAALGPDADFDALSRIARASGGQAYRISTAQQGQQALLDGLRRSRGLGS